MQPYKYAVDDVCVFTNKGSSGVTANDGKFCRIAELKKGPEWVGLLDEPHYVIEFLDGSNTFGCRESELEPYLGG